MAANIWSDRCVGTDAPQLLQGACVKGPLFMEHTTRQEAAFHIYFTLLETKS